MNAREPAVKPLRRDAQRNRQQLLTVASELFASKGIDVPVEEIVRRSGVGMGTLYRHFPTKHDLVDAVLEDAFDAYLRFAREAVAAPHAGEGFASFLERALALYAGNRGLMEVISRSDHGRERAAASRRRVRPLLRRLVDRAQAEGALRDDVTVEDVTMLLWGSGRVIEATEPVAPGYWRRYVALLLDGLRPAAATTLPQPRLTRTQLDGATRGTPAD